MLCFFAIQYAYMRKVLANFRGLSTLEEPMAKKINYSGAQGACKFSSSLDIRGVHGKTKTNFHSQKNRLELVGCHFTTEMCTHVAHPSILGAKTFQKI